MNEIHRLAKYMSYHSAAFGWTLTSLGLIPIILWMVAAVGGAEGWNATTPMTFEQVLAHNWGFFIERLVVVTLPVLIIGIVLLYVDSVKYHKRHPELYETSPSIEDHGTKHIRNFWLFAPALLFGAFNIFFVAGFEYFKSNPNIGNPVYDSTSSPIMFLLRGFFNGFGDFNASFFMFICCFAMILFAVNILIQLYPRKGL